MQSTKLQYPEGRKRFLELETDRMNGWTVTYSAPSLDGREVTPTQAARMLSAGQVIIGLSERMVGF